MVKGGLGEPSTKALQKEEKKGPGTHCMRMRRGTPDTIVYSPFIVHRTVRHAEPVNDHYGNAIGHYGDPSTCTCSVYQALSPPPLEGLGNEARLGAAGSTMVLQQWCAITLSPGNDFIYYKWTYEWCTYVCIIIACTCTGFCRIFATVWLAGLFDFQIR